MPRSGGTEATDWRRHCSSSRDFDVAAAVTTSRGTEHRATKRLVHKVHPMIL